MMKDVKQVLREIEDLLAQVDRNVAAGQGSAHNWDGVAGRQKRLELARELLASIGPWLADLLLEE